MHTISDMTPDEYLQTILAREQVDTGPFHAVRGMQTTLLPIIRRWAGDYLVNLHPSGSFAKGTANRSGIDIDVFISLHQNMPHTLSEIYSNLQSYLEHYGVYAPPTERLPQHPGERIQRGSSARKTSGFPRQDGALADFDDGYRQVYRAPSQAGSG